jgi:hypothetical protein
VTRERIVEARQVRSEVCQFVTTRPALVALSAWPRAHGVTQVPIEAIEHPG